MPLFILWSVLHFSYSRKHEGETMMLYMSSSFRMLGVESRDFSHAEKERTACRAEQIHKITTIITQNDFLGPYWVKVVVIL